MAVMGRRRRILFAILLVTIAVICARYSYESIRRFCRLFLPHSGYPLNQDQVLARYRVQKQQKHIPRIIHQVFHAGDASVLPAEWETQRQSCIEKNPDWEYKLWTEKMSHDFIATEYPWFLDTYDNLRYPVQKKDTVRYFILRHHGGIYIDLDYGCVTNLESLRAITTFVADGRRGPLSDKVLGGVPNHPFWVQVTESIPKYSQFYLFQFLTVLYGTGRWFLTAAWDSYHQDLAREGRAAERLTRLSMPQWRGAPEWSIFNSYRGGPATAWGFDVFAFAGEHFVVVIGSGIVGCLIGILLGVRLWRRRCLRKRQGYEPVSEIQV